MNTLLIVDDETDVRDFAANFFRKRKINVITASSGEEALVLVEKDKPRLVLLDIRMGGIDGIETLRQIKEIDKSIKVIMVSGSKPEENNTYERCNQLGALGYFHKPLELDKLEQIVFKELNC